MADYYFRNVIGNWNTNSSWSTSSGGAANGAVPGSADNANFDANSGTCSVDAVSPQFTNLRFTGLSGTSNYTRSINFTFGLTFSGTVTLSPSMSISGNGDLQLVGTSTLTSNGKTWPNNVWHITNSAATGYTMNIVGSWTSSAFYYNQLATPGLSNYLILGGGAPNNGDFYVQTLGFLGTSLINGTSKIIFWGTGSWYYLSNTSGNYGLPQIRNSIEFRSTLLTLGTSSNPNVYVHSDVNGPNFTYTSGSVSTTGSNLIFLASKTLNVSPIYFDQVSSTASVTLTLQSSLNCGTFSYNAPNGTDGNTLTLTGAGFTLSCVNFACGNNQQNTLIATSTSTRIYVSGTFSPGGTNGTFLSLVNLTPYVYSSGIIRLKSGATWRTSLGGYFTRLLVELEDGVIISSTASLAATSGGNILNYAASDLNTPGTVSMINGAMLRVGTATYNTGKLFFPYICATTSVTFTMQSDINCGTFSFMSTSTGGALTLSGTGYTFSCIDFYTSNANSTDTFVSSSIRLYVSGTFSAGGTTGTTGGYFYSNGSGYIRLKRGSTWRSPNPGFNTRVGLELEDGVIIGSTVSLDTTNAVNQLVYTDPTTTGTVSMINGSVINLVGATTTWNTGLLYIPNIYSITTVTITLLSDAYIGKFSYNEFSGIGNLSLGGQYIMNIVEFYLGNTGGANFQLGAASALVTSTFSISGTFSTKGTNFITNGNNPHVRLKTGSYCNSERILRTFLFIESDVRIADLTLGQGTVTYIGLPSTTITHTGRVWFNDGSAVGINVNTNTMNWNNVTASNTLTLQSDFYFTGTMSYSSAPTWTGAYNILGVNPITGATVGSYFQSAAVTGINYNNRGAHFNNYYMNLGSNNSQIQSSSGATISVWGVFYHGGNGSSTVTGLIYTLNGAYCTIEMKPGSTYSQTLSGSFIGQFRLPLLFNGGCWIDGTISWYNNGELLMLMKYNEGTGAINHTGRSLLTFFGSGASMSTGNMNWYSINLNQNVSLVSNLRITGTLSITTTNTITLAGFSVTFSNYQNTATVGSILQTVSSYTYPFSPLNIYNYAVGTGTTNITLINPVNVYGNLIIGGTNGTTGIISGTPSITLLSGSIWGPHTGTSVLRNNVIIYGGSGLSGNLYYNTGTISWIGDSNISPGDSTLNLTGNSFLNTDKMLWNNITSSSGVTTTLRSDLVAVGTVTASNSIFTATGNTFSIGGSLIPSNTTATFSNIDIIMNGTGTITNGTIASKNFFIDTFGRISLSGTITLPITTLKYVKGKMNPLGSTVSFTQATTVLGFHQAPLDVVSVTNNINLTMDQFFSGVGSLYTTVKPTTATGTYSITFQDGFEKYSKFVKIAGAQIPQNNLIMLTPGANKSGTLQGGDNKGIRYTNTSPFSAPKNLPFVTKSFDSGQLNQLTPNASDPNFRNTKGDRFNL